ncbi:UNVERIFIED_CONTAM: hypothetical protein Slati_2916000 [Sesamum latifolium]|uniref:Uncharacterized protein n=1 Tax=Sesamum latifolium TaxID=2727402 RepID=A0AAW2VGW0_9LAMI
MASRFLRSRTPGGMASNSSAVSAFGATSGYGSRLLSGDGSRLDWSKSSTNP